MPLAYDALITVATEFRIPIIHTPSAEQTAQLLVTLVSRSLREGKATGPLLRKIKKENPIYIQQLSGTRVSTWSRRKTGRQNAPEIPYSD